eukprot:TRINITY_DN37161_c0_g1_i1.p1 TRINITY_DN37161_c0_g1~~TRINITY_DN37161_c0_g1_i1.p1  ORF type:complete len:496 (-),score=142.30 TRINITY_DN37161_c0_g1_i1:100-1587(-)
MSLEAPDPAAMQAMLSSMAGGMGGHFASNPAADTGLGAIPGVPPVDPAFAAQNYMSMLQYISQGLSAQQAPLGGIPGMPPFPMPGMPPAPYSSPMGPPEAAVNVSVEGMKFQYQLTEDDLMKVFSRYGAVKQIRVDEAGSSAVVIFHSFPDATAAMNDLNGKVLNGLEGTLRISWLQQPAPNAAVPPPYPGMPFPGWGFPPAAPPQAGGWPAVPPPGGCGAAPAAPPSPEPFRDSASDKSPSGGKSMKKYTCRFMIGIENDKDFQVARRIIGAKGANMKRIVRTTDAKLRLRGVGSGYFEGAGQKESSEPLQLCISCTSQDGYKTAVKGVEDLLKRVYDEYKQFCRESGRQMPDLDLQFSENQLVYSSRSPPVAPGPAGVLPAGSQPIHIADDDAGDSPSKGKKGKLNANRGAPKRETVRTPSGEVERGEPGPNAPPVDEIEKLIDERNEARRANNFPEADRIRQLLHSRGVALMDEPGGRGRGAEVTTWRYWRD